MVVLLSSSSLFFFLLLLSPSTSNSNNTSLLQVHLLLEIKAALDPSSTILHTWVAGNEPCCCSSTTTPSSSSCSPFEGILCNDAGQVATVSLQGKGLTGFIPAAFSLLDALTGLYLHYNMLHGTIPPQLSTLTSLTDLYLNVNLLTGSIPSHLASLTKLQALQLCCNAFQGSIPFQLGALKRLTVLSLHHNNLTGEIPSSLGSIPTLTRLYLGFNSLNGSIPASLSNLAKLSTLDVRSNNLSGAIPVALHKLQKGFLYDNNPLLCGNYFIDLLQCNTSASLGNPKPLGSNLVVPPISTAAESVNPQEWTKSGSMVPQISIMYVVAPFALGGLVVGLFTFVLFRRHKQRIGSAYEVSGKLCGDLSKEEFGIGESFFRCSSPLNDYITSSRRASRSLGSFTGTVIGSLESSQYDFGELEVATNYFSDNNLLGKSGYSAVYKGVLKDGSVVAIRSLPKAMCKAGETVFKEVVRVIAELRQENIVSLKGFCFSSGTTDCFLVYDYVSNRNLQQHLDNSTGCFDWVTRLRIAYGVAKGLEFMHRAVKNPVIHQNVSATNVLLDPNYNAFISDGGLNRLLVQDIVFSKLKAAATYGYLCPEYASTGKLDEKSDVYAFGVVLLQLLLFDRRYAATWAPTDLNIVSWARSLISAGGVEDLMVEEASQDGVATSLEVVLRMAGVAFSCTNEDARVRPSMSEVVILLGGSNGEEDSTGLSSLSSSSSCSSSYSSSSNDFCRRRQQQDLFAMLLPVGR